VSAEMPRCWMCCPSALRVTCTVWPLCSESHSIMPWVRSHASGMGASVTPCSRLRTCVSENGVSSVCPARRSRTRRRDHEGGWAHEAELFDVHLCCSAAHAPMTYSLFTDSVVARPSSSEVSVMSTVEILSASS
jgi:hypothetical protein